MKQILFVDDEPLILGATARMLRGHAPDWRLRFALGADAALAELTATPADVVVCDMRMPGMDGVQLLREVQRRWPQTARLVLSGFAESEAATRAAAVAQQYLAKPCDAQTLIATIERLCATQELLRGDAIKRVVGSIDALPTLPHIYCELTTLLGNPDTTVDDVARVVSQDMAISAKLLQLVNSSFFGLARGLASIREAVGYLGLAQVRSLVLCVGVFRQFPATAAAAVAAIQSASTAIATLAAHIAPDVQTGEEAFVGGLLCDVGRLVVLSLMPKEHAAVIENVEATGVSQTDAEALVLGATHGDIGAYLLALWGLPFPVVEAVAYHHHPDRGIPGRFDAMAVVHAAVIIAGAVEQSATGAGGERGLAPADVAWFEKVGVTDRVEEWLAVAGDRSARAERPHPRINHATGT